MEDDRTVLSPGESVRPQMGQEEAKDMVLRLYGLEVSETKELNSYDDRNFRVWVKESSNPYINPISPDGYVLKVLNSLDSKSESVFDAQNDMILHVHSQGVPTTRPLKNLQGELKSLEKLSSNSGQTNLQYIVRLFEFMPGRILYGVPYTADLVFEIGKVAGRIDHICQTFYHVAFEKHKRIWSLTEIPKLEEFLHCLDEKKSTLVKAVVDSFNMEVVSRYNVLQRGLIHGDFSEQNILVRQKQDVADNFELAGILDFGDSTISFYIFEIAILMCYMMLESTVLDYFECAGHALAGYLSTFDLKSLDLHILKECIAGRLAQSLVMGAYSAAEDPDNADYFLITAPKGWKLLERFWKTSKEEMYQVWRNVLNKYSISICFE